MRVAVLVSSRVPEALQVAAAWARDGRVVEVVLLDEAAAAVRVAHRDAEAVAAAAAQGVTVAVHDEAAVRRGIGSSQLLDGVKLRGIDEVVDLLADSADKAVWL